MTKRFLKIFLSRSNISPNNWQVRIDFFS